MALIKLTKPVTVGDATYDEIDFDPSIDALEAYEASIKKGDPETTAIKIMMAFDGDIPIEAAGKVRMSAIVAALKGFDSPFGLSPSSRDGEPTPR